MQVFRELTQTYVYCRYLISVANALLIFGCLFWLLRSVCVWHKGMVHVQACVCLVVGVYTQPLSLRGVCNLNSMVQHVNGLSRVSQCGSVARLGHSATSSATLEVPQHMQETIHQSTNR